MRIDESSHMWIGLAKVASAASLTASSSVGWGWQVRAMSSERGAELHRDRDLGDQDPGLGADDVGAQHPVGRGVGQDLDEPVGVGRPSARGCSP